MMIEGFCWAVMRRRKFCFLVSCVLCLTSFSFGQINTEIDTAHIKIGEPVHYKLTVPFQAGDEILLPRLKDTLSFHIEILDQKIDTVSENGTKKLVQQLSLTSFDPGEFLIRSLPVVINSDTLLSGSFQIKVDEVRIDSANLTGFPIKPIMQEEYKWKDYWNKYWVYLTVGVLVFLALIIAAILFLREKKNKGEKSFVVKTPYDEAKEALKNIDKKKYLEKGQLYPFYSELSFLLRRYIGRIYHFSSLELLSGDLVDYIRKSGHLQQEDIEKLREFLYDSDLVKFAKSAPDEQKHEFYRKWAEDFIEKTRPLELEDETIQELKPNEKYRKIE